MGNEYTPVDLWPCQFLCDVSTESPIATGMAVQFATDVLWALSGRRFGYTTATLRPSRTHPSETPFPDGWLSWPGTQMPPLGASANGGNLWWFACDPTMMREIRLPAPVAAVTQVKIDGNVLNPNAYRLDKPRSLVRTDDGVWPFMNNFLLDDTEIGTWTVTAQFGEGIPSGAPLAIGELACQFLKAIHGEDCRLPRTVTSLARQGVTIQMPNPLDVFAKGVTGLYLADLFISTWNPKHLPARSRTYSVDTHPARVIGSSGSSPNNIPIIIDGGSP